MVYESSLSNHDGINVTQDTIHLANKARNRLLKKDINLPMGKHKVSIHHLQNLLRQVHKSVHGITYSDVFPTDRMNYGSFEKLIQDRVINALKERIPGSEATVQYLLTFRDIINSFLSFDLKPLERIKLIWRSLYFLRIWREFIKASPSYTLGNNFITSNTYYCVEINAKHLTDLMKKFRDRLIPECFLPVIFDSQTCERSFRLFRSLGSTQSTKINFSFLELIHMIGRIEIQHDVMYCKLNVDGIEFPHKRKTKSTVYQLPTDEEIYETIAHAKLEAIKIAERFEMKNCLVDWDQIDKFHFNSTFEINDIEEEEEEESHEENHEENLFDCGEQEDDLISGSEEDIDLPNDSDSTLDSTSKFLHVIDEKGTKRKIRKSTYVWMLTDPSPKLSNDRCKRFKTTS